MQGKRVRLENQLDYAFSSVYKDIDTLANLIYESNRLPKNEAEVFKIKSNLKQSVKAIEFLTTADNS
ncbi:hypothetical protein PY093_01830 [Cytobacillus sp. S13-E01]|uniref:hypothetical protein n=1 Tax=Cytobacillus sp. S13-E01 TaxID=3031326 RepID=UPI0023D7E0BB|nr:hypothetical protein [Cytobacillus sp. S13-E01]MDF0725449.1 hypothetical protein [Cytobacillus sp. S13-E01]